MPQLSYIDSSALLRECFGEGDRSLVRVALRNSPVSSYLLAIEVPVAIASRVHWRLIDEATRDRVLSEAQPLLQGIAFTDIDAGVRSETADIALHHLIRSLDAIHLATAVVIARQQRRHGNALRFCTADRRLASVAGAVLGAGAVDLLPPLP